MASRAFDRCTIEGAEHLTLLQSGGRPVVLASLHYGPMTVGGEWLRSRGFPIAAVAVIALVQRSAFRRACGQIRDRLAGIEHVPPFIEVGHVMSMREHLEKHGVIGVAIEGGYGKHVTFPTVGETGLCIRTGTFKLAHIAGAHVIPFLTEARPFFRFKLYFGQPIPDAYIADPRQHNKAAEDMLRQILPIIQRHPGQCTDFLLHALRPANAPAANEATADKVLEGMLRA
jgi:lauroyl/myristoyl acyltransferase